MKESIYVVVHTNVNGWFRVVREDEQGSKLTLYEGSDFGKCLTYAACQLGRKLALPLVKMRPDEVSGAQPD